MVCKEILHALARWAGGFKVLRTNRRAGEKRTQRGAEKSKHGSLTHVVWQRQAPKALIRHTGERGSNYTACSCYSQ